METNQNRCTLLPNIIGEKVIKITLECDKAAAETARAVLFVTPGGFVKEHSHQIGQNPDSEVYINLFNIVNQGTSKVNIKPEVAGSNSPTGKLKHSIEKSNRPQIYLAIKKGQNKEAWQTFSNDFEEYLQNLHFGCSVYGNQLSIFSNGNPKKKEFVAIDFVNNRVKYLDSNKDNQQSNIQESVSLDDLLNLQNDLGIER